MMSQEQIDTNVNIQKVVELLKKLPGVATAKALKPEASAFENILTDEDSVLFLCYVDKRDIPTDMTTTSNKIEISPEVTDLESPLYQKIGFYMMPNVYNDEVMGHAGIVYSMRKRLIDYFVKGELRVSANTST